MTGTFKKFILCLLAVALLAGLWGCAYRPRPARTEDGLTLFRLGFSGSPDSLNPYTAASTESAAVFSLIYDTLFVRELRTGQYAPALCESCSVRDSAAGGKLWSIALRPNVYWHDGRPVTASDVEFSLQSLKELSVLYGYPYCELLDVTGISVEDDAHLAMVVWGEEQEILRCLSRIPILPRHVWNDFDWMNYDSSGVSADLSRAMQEIGKVPLSTAALTGSGLYVFDGYDGETCSLRLNENYWGAAARAQAVELRFGLDSTADALREGAVDACWDMSLRDWQSVGEEKGLRTAAGTAGELFMLSFNFAGSESLGDKQLRMALEHCADRQSILLWAFGGGYAERGLLSPYSLWHYTPGGDSGREYDTAEAAGLLDKANYLDRNGDGYRETPGGKPLALTLVYSSADPAWETAAELFASSCARAGLAVSLKPMTPAALTQAVASGRYDLYLHAESTDPEPYQIFRSFYWDEGDNGQGYYDARSRFISRGWNTSGYENRRYDELYCALLSAADEEEIRAAAAAAGELLCDECAAIPIGFKVNYQAYSSVWYYLCADRTSGLLFTPATLGQQMQTMDAMK